VIVQVAIPTASPGALADLISVVGIVGATAWVGWRFGPTLLRGTGWCSWCVAWATGGQGGYGYCVAFLALGMLAWTTGTVWYAKRRGRWPSVLSERLLRRVLGRHGPAPLPERPNDRVVVPPRRL
jgi:hypothetical protein